jgi:hypothetical protein
MRSTHSNLVFGNHLSFYLEIEENQENLCRDGRSQGPSGHVPTSGHHSGNWIMCVHLNVLKNIVLTSQRIHCTYSTKTKRSILLRLPRASEVLLSKPSVTQAIQGVSDQRYQNASDRGC